MTMIQTEQRHRLLIALPMLAAAPATLVVAKTRVEVCKGPRCGCCQDWIAHLEAHGFAVAVHDDGNSDARQRLGVPLSPGSCHTALVDGYGIEGHVPARDIRRHVIERPRAAGLAVPPMPLGSPGMNGPAYAGRKDPFDVLLVRCDGRSTVFQSCR